jgi:hypothetical protein
MVSNHAVCFSVGERYQSRGGGTLVRVQVARFSPLTCIGWFVGYRSDRARADEYFATVYLRLSRWTTCNESHNIATHC